MVDAPVSVWREVLETNLLAPVRLCARFAPVLAASGRGSIINVVSGSGLLPSPRRRAVRGVEGRAMDGHPVAGRGAGSGGAGERPVPRPHHPGRPESITRHRHLLPLVPLGRLARADELVGAAIYLASDAASYTTGELSSSTAVGRGDPAADARDARRGHCRSGDNLNSPRPYPRPSTSRDVRRFRWEQLGTTRMVSYEQKRAALDPDVLLAEAERLSGSSDVGNERFVHALRMMTRYYAEDIQVSAQGLGLVRSTIVRQLVNRTRFEADLRRHPEILDEDVERPDRHHRPASARGPPSRTA